MNCNACGAELAEGAKFCGSCGAQVNGISGAKPNDNDKLLLVLAHLGGIFFGFIPSLIVYIIRKDQPGIILDNAKEALNWQISMLIGCFASILLSFILIGVFFLWALIVCNIIFCIMGAVKASPQKVYRYPFALRLVK